MATSDAYRFGVDTAGVAWAANATRAVDLRTIDAGLFTGPNLNAFLAAGPDRWREVRNRATRDLGSAGRSRAVGELAMGMPVAIGDYVDFYSSIHHATNLGRMFRPDAEPLLRNWRRLPVGYHGRSGTIVAAGSDIPRPHGLRLVDGEPEYGPSERLDIELEIGTVIGVGNDRGRPVATADAAEHLFGICLVNDWSARDIQAFEYQPLGPFLGKSFATSMSPWIVAFDALDDTRVEPPAQYPPVAEYLQHAPRQRWGLALQLEVAISTATMRAAGAEPHTISRVGFADMYWTADQQLAHLTVNGAGTRPGDLFASGTVSGPEPGSEGSLIELTRNGADPIELPDGSTRTFLEDGDTIVITGWAGALDMGSVSGTITNHR